MDITSLRDEISQIDQELVALFVRRMHVAAQIADYKKEHSLPVLDETREQHVLKLVADQAGPEMSDYAQVLYRTLFAISRDYQSKLYEVV